MYKRFIIRCFRSGQTHPAPLALWDFDVSVDAERFAKGISPAMKTQGCYLKMYDTETGIVSDV